MSDKSKHENLDEKGITPVAGRTVISNKSNLWFLLFIPLAVWFIFYSGGENVDDRPITAPDDESFAFGKVENLPKPVQAKEQLVNFVEREDKVTDNEVQVIKIRDKEEEKRLKMLADKYRAEAEKLAALVENRAQARSSVVFDHSVAPSINVAAVNGSPGGDITPSTGSGNGALVKRVEANVIEDLSTVILQGKTISGYLETAIETGFTCNVRAIISEDVYSYNGATLLVPQGSRAVGTCLAGIVTGQTRVFVTWRRIITPGGVSMEIDARGTDEIGRTGMTGDVKTHFFKRFGYSMMISIIGATTVAAIDGSDDGDDIDRDFAEEVADDFQSQAEIALSHQINIPPTINVPQGAPVNIFINQDIDFSTALERFNRG